MPLVGLRTVCPHPSPIGRRERDHIDVDVVEFIILQIFCNNVHIFVEWLVSTHKKCYQLHFRGDMNHQMHLHQVTIGMFLAHEKIKQDVFSVLV